VYSDVEQLWYADDAGAGGKFACIHTIFIKLMRWGCDFGYFPEPTKSILVTLLKNVERAKGGLWRPWFPSENWKLLSQQLY
jgi:hypothetical protein